MSNEEPAAGNKDELIKLLSAGDDAEIKVTLSASSGSIEKAVG